MVNPDIFAYSATVLNVVMLFPQVVTTWKTKKTKELAMPTLIMFVAACAFWTIYGVIKTALPIILANTILGSLNGVLIYIKLRYSKNK